MDQNAYDNYFLKLLADDFSMRPPSDQPFRQTEGPVKSVNFLVRENTKAHYTNMYDLVGDELRRPVFRRGQHFRIQIIFKIPFQLTKKSLRLDFNFGWNPLPGNGTLVNLQVTNAIRFSSEKDWCLRMRSKTENTILLDVMTSPAAPVGVWRMTIVTHPRRQIFDVPQHFYIVFNPWCKDDLVYMEKEEWRKEYVCNNHGMIFVGKFPIIKHMDWIYSQFSSVALPAAIRILAKSKLKTEDRGSPIEISRAITRAVREQVLEGRWEGTFDDGVEPLKWKGSLDILRIFMETNKRVKYGQCWNLAGLTCSICRALGIPCRVVTNFESAHDATNDLVIEICKDMDGNIIKNEDAIWDFHVWNDVWMARPDLPEGYGGWQAIDMTQRKENSVPTLSEEFGPASLEAVKRGEIGLRFDTMAIFSAVNADRKVWQMKEDMSKVYSSINEDFVGKCIVTKAVGQADHEDVTNQYKFKEGTKEERRAIINAAKLSGRDEMIFIPQQILSEDIFFDLMKTDSMLIGMPLSIAILVENRSKFQRKIQVSLGASSVEYNGVVSNQLDISEKPSSEDKLYRRKLKLEPGQKEIIRTTLKPEIYINRMSYMGHIRIFASGVVKETNQVWFMDGGAVIRKPQLAMEMNHEFEVGQRINIILKFNNPLDLILSKCSFNVEGSCSPDTINFNFRNINPRELVRHQIQFMPEKKGPAIILAVFNSDFLKNVCGSKNVNIC